MTILAGIISRYPWASISDSVCESFRKNLSRHPQDKPIEYRNNKVFLLKIDIGAFESAGHLTTQNKSFSMLAGEPLLTCSGTQAPGRLAQLAFLQTEWEQEKFHSLRSASGTFCAVHHNPISGKTYLMTDRLGLRPIFYSVLDNYIFFSSALRILEGIPEVPKKIDVQAVAEITGFGYPLGNATPYQGIKTLLPCEVAIHHAGEMSLSKYFDWDTLKPLTDTEGTIVEKTDQLFKEAVRRRLQGDRTTFAYLSGGLDSRCVVAALVSENSHTYTFNFSLEKTQDQAFAKTYANQAGTIHQEIPTNPGPNWSAIMAQAWRDSPHRIAQQPEHPNIVWTGEGGSVGLGHVYITPEIVRQLRAGNTEGAIDTFLDQQKKIIPSRILASSWSVQFKDHLREKLLLELRSITAQNDPVRTFYIFLNLNGPRRHLFTHFETIDQHRLEYQIPFYDSALMEYLTAVPADPFLYHRLYVRWLDSFDPAVKQVPWQSYPGHVACGVDIPQDLPDQWTAPATVEHQATQKMDLLRRSASMLADKNFPIHLLRKHYLRLIWWAWKLKFRDYSYALEAALAYHQYWKKSGL